MILQGDSLAKISEVSSDSIQTVITSPPYWGLRNYDNDEQLGQESSPEMFVLNLVNLFQKIKRVLKDDGTVWVASLFKDWRLSWSSLDVCYFYAKTWLVFKTRHYMA